MRCCLSPSMLSIDFGRIEEELKKLEKSQVPYIHIDVMDGVFVPNISFGMPVIKGIRKYSNLIFDVHLMIVEPERYIAEFGDAGADIITFHIESTKNPELVIEKIKNVGAKVGITLKPATPVEELKPYLSCVDMVLVMSVEPGFGGQKFMESQVEKIKELVKLRQELKLSYDIEVDGGITQDNVKIVLDAGANIIVAGSAVFGQKDSMVAANQFNEIFQEYK